jgi:DNA invertase Pin-like site-specific DNA recombinase
MRRLLGSLLLVAVVGAGAAVPVGAQEDRPPRELWDEFPLEQPPPDSARETPPEGGAAPSSSGETDSDGGTPAGLPLALAAIAALGLVAGVAALRRRSRPAAPGAALPSGGAAPASEPKPPDRDAAMPETPKALPRPAPQRTPAPATSARRDNGRRAPGAPTPPTRAVPAFGYASVSATDGRAGEELKVQIRMIQQACQDRGLTLVKVVRDIESHASSDLRRPGLTYALDRLAAREAACLVVTSLERLTRTASHLGTMLGWLNECDARLIVLDLDLDTGTHEGQLGAKALAEVGGLERKKVEERTRKGLEAARLMRRSGRPAVSDRPSLKRRIADMRAEGMTLQAIADTLNAEGVPTLRGGAEWRPSSVQAAAGYKRPSRKDRLRQATPRDGRSKAK